jgi:hypothetical protein
VKPEEILERIQSMAKAQEKTAEANRVDALGLNSPLTRYYRGRAQAFNEVARAIESLSENRWEKKARELLDTTFVMRSGWGDMTVQTIVQALHEAYNDGYEQGSQEGYDNPRKPDRG